MTVWRESRELISDWLADGRLEEDPGVGGALCTVWLEIERVGRRECQRLDSECQRCRRRDPKMLPANSAELLLFIRERGGGSKLYVRSSPRVHSGYAEDEGV